MLMNVPDLLTHPEALRAHIRAALAGRGGAPKPPPQGLRQAAVPLMVVHADGEAALLLTKRSETVDRHKGEISLPGGAIAPRESPQAAATRQTTRQSRGRTQ